MALYLVDFENVHDSGISGVTNLTENDDIFIFYSVKSEHMSFDTHVSIMKSAARVKYIKLRRSAKNYLDFQLVTHLGYLIGSGQPGPYFIISKDTGYDSALDYWKDHGVTVTRQPSIGYNLTQRKATGQAPTHNTPPALVTVKEGNTISNFQVPMVQVPMTPQKEDISADEQSAASSILDPFVDVPMESAENDISADMVSEEPAASSPEEESEASAAEEPKSAPEKKSRSSRSRRSNSRKKAAEDTSAAADQTAADSNEDSSNAQPEDAQRGKETGKSKKASGKSKKAADQSAAASESAPAASADLPTPEDLSSEQIKITPQTLPESYRKRVRTALKGKNIPSAYYSSIYKAIINSYDKLALNNLLVKTFASSRGGEIYNLIKDIFTDYQASNG